MSILKKRTILIALSALTLVLVFVQSAYAASVTVSLTKDRHSAVSQVLYLSKGDTVQFYGESSLTSKHNVDLALFDPDGNRVDSVILPPNSYGGDTYTVTVSGNYVLGLGCGGVGQNGCSAYGVLETLD